MQIENLVVRDAIEGAVLVRNFKGLIVNSLVVA